MLSELFGAVAEAVLSYTLDKLDPAETLKTWLKRDPARLAFQKALARAYAAFARQYPDYTTALFDQSFLTREAVPEISKILIRSQHPDPAMLARVWCSSIGAGPEFSERATKPSADFLHWLESELKAEKAFQALSDSRALDSLPHIEAEIEKLTADLQRGLDAALKAASEYQKVTLHIEGDVKDSNIIIGDNNQLTVNKYYYSGDFVSLNEYYIPPDAVFQRVRVDEFVGREWLTAKVDAFLNDPNRKSGAFLLIGDAGVGKTSFMAHLVRERRYLHLFAEQVAGQAMLQRALQSLGSQLVTRFQIDPYKDRDTLNVLASFPDFLERLLRLAASTLTNGEKIIIVCDALDEAGTFPDGNVFGLPNVLPDGVYFILSQRPVNTKLPNLEPVIEKLEAHGVDNLQDMEDYLRAVAKRPAVAGQIRSKGYSDEFFIQILKEKSHGVWMYLHYIIKEIESGNRAPLDLANLPTGLVGYYAEYWETWRTGKRGKGEAVWAELYSSLLATLAASQEAIPVETLIQWADVTAKPREVARLLNEYWRAFITEKEISGKKVYAPYHLSFKDFITGRVDTDKLPPAQANLVKDLAEQTVDAHKHIVNALEKECNGEWEKLVDQDYPRLHLSAHLADAGEYETLWILLTEGGEKIKWADAREKKEGTYAGYLSDLIYVWDLAQREGDYGLAIRCMLIENSIHALASNIPPSLLAELARTGMWSYARCLSTIRQKTDPSDQAISLKLIASGLPTILFQEALAIAREMPSDSARANVLSDLVPYLIEELKPQALATALAITDKYDRARALCALAPHLGVEFNPQVLGAARDLKDAWHRARILSALSPYLTEDLKSRALHEAFAAAQEIIKDYDRAWSLTALVPYLTEEIKLQVLTTARGFKDARNRARVLSAIAPQLAGELQSQIFQEALASIQETEDAYYKVDIFSALVPHLPEKLKHLALAIVCDFKEEYYRAQAFAALAPYLTEELKPDALMAVSEIQADYARAEVLSGLAPYLTKELKSQAFAIACDIKDAYHRAQALSAFASELTEELKSEVFQEALAAARGRKDIGAHVLSALAPYLSQDLKSQALSSVREFNELETKASATARHNSEDFTSEEIVSALAPHLTEELKSEALATASKIKGETARVRALSALAPYLTNELKAQALAMARELKNEHTRAEFLSALAPHLTEELKPEALATASEIKGETARAHVLSALTPYLTEELKFQALAATRAIYDEDNRARVLFALTPYFTEELKPQVLPEVLAAALQIQAVHVRARVLSALAPYLTEELKPQILAVARELDNDFGSRARVLCALAPHIMEESKAEVLQEALVAVCEIKGESYRPNILRDLLPYLTEELKSQALVAVGEIQSEPTRSLALAYLAPHLNNDELREQALAIACEIKDDISRAWALRDLAPYLTPTLSSQALGAACGISRDASRAEALSALAPYLTEELHPQAILAAIEIREHYHRAHALSALAPHLSEEFRPQVLQEALKGARSVWGEDHRARTLAAVVPYLNEELKNHAIREMLMSAHTIKAPYTRAGVLSTLVPCLTEELRSHVLQEALAAARASYYGSQRAPILIRLAPYLAEEIRPQVLQEAFEAVHTISDEEDLSRILFNLPSQLGKELAIRIFQEFLLMNKRTGQVLEEWRKISFEGVEKTAFNFLKLTSQKERKHTLEIVELFIPALFHLAGADIAIDVLRAITDTARWWP